MKYSFFLAVALVLSCAPPNSENNQLVRPLESNNLSGLLGESLHDIYSEFENQAGPLEDDLVYLMAIDPDQFLAQYSESGLNFENSTSHHTTVDDQFDSKNEVHLLSPKTVSPESCDVRVGEDVSNPQSIAGMTRRGKGPLKFTKAHESILKSILISSRTDMDKRLVFERASESFTRAGLPLIKSPSLSQHKRRIAREMNLSGFIRRVKPKKEHKEIIKKVGMDFPENGKVHQLFSTVLTSNPEAPSDVRQAFSDAGDRDSLLGNTRIGERCSA